MVNILSPCVSKKYTALFPFMPRSHCAAERSILVVKLFPFGAVKMPPPRRVQRPRGLATGPASGASPSASRTLPGSPVS